MKILDLFSGSGGFSYASQRSGMSPDAFCEYEECARKVLQKHWPNVPIYNDVNKLDSNVLLNDGIEFDIITSGFPCVDISISRKGACITGLPY